MKALIIPVTPYQQNCSVLWCESTKESVIVDPGGDVENILQAVKQSESKPKYILLTHAHLDHVSGSKELANTLGVPIIGPHKDDLFWLEQLPDMCQRMGFPPAESFVPDQWLVDGDVIECGTMKFDVVHCPGHTPGHVVFVEKAEKVALVGDVLFQGSIGRTDFPRGDHATLIASIKDNLFPLGDDITFLPGHGPTSTFGHERETNPFVSDSNFG